MKRKTKHFSWMIVLAALIVSSQRTEAANVADIALYQGKDRQSKIEEGAKKEGEIVWYTSLTADDSQQLVELFEKRYPFVKIKLTRLTSERTLQRYLAEFQAGRFNVDIIDTNNFQMELPRRKGALQAFHTPSTDKYDKRFLQPQGFWVASRLTMIVMGYNTRQVPPSEAPKKYEDLLDPKWKGKIAVEREQTEWFISLMEHWGEEKGKAFFQKLGAQNPSIRSGHSQMAQLIIAGEDPLSPNAYSHHFPRAMAKGAPADWNNLEPVVGTGGVSALAKNAPHPHAAMLFLDFFFSKDGGQKVIHDANRIGTHPELVPNPPRLRQGFDFLIVDAANYMDKIGQYENLWREWVLGEK